MLEDQKFDCLVLDLGLPGMTRLGGDSSHVRWPQGAAAPLPLVVYTAQGAHLKRGAQARSRHQDDRHQEVKVTRTIDAGGEAVLEDPNAATASFQTGSNGGSDFHDPSLAGRKVLVVDDDIRNIFALTAMLERHQMDVTAVDSGQEAIDALSDRSDFDVALRRRDDAGDGWLRDHDEDA